MTNNMLALLPQDIMTPTYLSYTIGTSTECIGLNFSGSSIKIGFPVFLTDFNSGLFRISRVSKRKVSLVGEPDEDWE
ncbi:hypothetical protein I7I48_04284 [Histoplasma ohiense]|nr:hypothetical protein I7I48_04284 [Histoplasma ohiense (nom. inval.)]